MARFCTECGAQVADDKKFCTDCGAPMNAGGAPEPALVGAAVSTTSAASAAPAQAAPQPVYQAPAAAPLAPPPMAVGDAALAKDSKYAPIGVGGYIGIMLLMFLPVINLILLIVWACGGCKKINKRNLARATLIMTAIGLVLSVVTYFVGKSLINRFLRESGLSAVTQITGSSGGIPGGDSLGALSGLLGEGALSGLTGDEGPSEDEDLNFEEEIPPSDPEWDENESSSSGEEDLMEGLGGDDAALLMAIQNSDRDALIAMGYSPEEVDQVLTLFQGDGAELLGLLGG